MHSLRIVDSSIQIGQANSWMDGLLHVYVRRRSLRWRKSFGRRGSGGEKSFISAPGYPGNIRHSRSKISFGHVSNGRRLDVELP